LFFACRTDELTALSQPMSVFDFHERLRSVAIIDMLATIINSIMATVTGSMITNTSIAAIDCSPRLAIGLIFFSI